MRPSGAGLGNMSGQECTFSYMYTGQIPPGHVMLWGLKRAMSGYLVFLRIAFSSHVNSFGNVRGWVSGAWGETSEEVHTLDQKLAEFWPPPKIKKF